MKKIFKSIDIFPLNIQFNLKDKELKKTFFGGLFSILLILVTLFLVIFNLYNYFSNRIPIVLSTNEFYANVPSEEFDLSNINFINMFYIPTNFILIDLKQVASSANAYNFDINPTKIETIPIGELVPCIYTTNNLSKNLSDILRNRVGINPNLTTCYNANSTAGKVELGGSIVETKQSRSLVLEAYYDICGSGMFTNYCNDINNLENQNVLFTMYFNNYYVNMDLPIGYSEFIDYESIGIQSSNNLIVKIKIKKNVIESDDNYLFKFKPIKTYSYYTISNIQFQPIKRTSTVNIAKVQFLFELDKYKQTFRREYVKLDQVLSNTLSIFSVLLMFFENLTKIFEFGSVQHYIFKKLYFFESDDMDSNLVQKKNLFLIEKMKRENGFPKNIEIELNDMGEERYLNVQGPNNLNINDKKESLDDKIIVVTDKNLWKKINKNEIPQNMKIKRLFFQLCKISDKNLENNLMKINFAEEMLYFDLNIINLLKRLIDVEMIKDILFNERQSNLIKILYGRRINSSMNIDEYKNQIINKHFQFDKVRKDLEEIEQSYDICFCSNDKLDNKIVKLLHFNK